MKHISAAAYYTDSWLLSGYAVLNHGERLESDRQKGTTSAWSYEDLPSNLLGVYFVESYLESDVAKGKSLVQNLETFLRDLGFVDLPFTVAPNARHVYDATVNKRIGPENRYYEIFYATKPVHTPLGLAIIDYLNKFWIKAFCSYNPGISQPLDPCLHHGQFAPSEPARMDK